MRFRILILILVLLSKYYELSFAAEAMIDYGDVALNQAVVDLTNDMTILCLAAHPDDEDGATLSYYRKRYGVRTAVLYATRGEGGQNEIGSELYEELGVIRAFETDAATKVYGAEVYNLNKRDFGYSKSAEETFRVWGHDDSLRRLVQVIRKVRPDVVITNHDTLHGHGHHQALGILAIEAFEAANDSERFPEHIIEGLEAWQVKRMFLRCTKEEADVAINVGEYDQLRGYSYAQIANEGLKLHKSQGMGGRISRGPVFNYYKLIRTSQPIQDRLIDLFDQLPKTPIKSTIENAKSTLSIKHDQVAEDIFAYIKSLEDSKTDLQELQEAAARSLDLYLTVTTDDDILTRGQKFVASVSLTNCGKCAIKNLRFQLRAPGGWSVENKSSDIQQLGYNETATGVFNVKVPEDAPLTFPYAEHLYDDSFMKPLIKGIVQYNAFGTDIFISSDATFDIAEDMEINVLPESSIVSLPYAGRSMQYVVNISNRLPENMKGQIEFITPLSKSIEERDFELGQDQQAFFAFDLAIPPDISTGDLSLDAKVYYSKGTITRKSRMRVIDVRTADGLYVGYVKSYDNTIEWALKQLNVKCNALESDDLRFSDLSVYDTIILDIRAYLVRKDLVASNQRLLDYVRDGGNLIVMYNKTYEWDKHYAPYEIELSSDRVTVEESPMTILSPEHPLFTYPNKITDQDWEGWIQERGLYFPSRWSSRFKELLSCNDPGEKPLRGGYLVAQYGKGTYIYTSYVWYRQLQNLNSGAFRNFANMVSLPKNTPY